MRRLRRSTRVLCGTGLHTGRPCRAAIRPASTADQSITFVRADAGPAVIPVALGAVCATDRRTVLGQQGVTVSTVEHVLAALAGCCITTAQVHLEGPELPAMDGSAGPWVEAIRQAGTEKLERVGPSPCWVVTRPWREPLEHGGWVALRPATGLSIDCSIDYPHQAIGLQRQLFQGPDPDRFIREIAPARTFGLLSEARALRQEGLALGATLASTVVFGPDGALNPGGLRFCDEPVRHKLLDAIGDLALLGAPFCGALELHRCGHGGLVSALSTAVAAGVLELTESPAESP